MLNDASSSTTLETSDAYGASAPTHPLDELVLHAHRPFQDDFAALATLPYHDFIKEARLKEDAPAYPKQKDS